MNSSSSHHPPRCCTASEGAEETMVVHRRQRTAINRGHKRSIRRRVPCASSLILSMLHHKEAHSIQHPLSSSLSYLESRKLQSGLSIGSSVNLDECYNHLHTSDTNQNSILSPSEFLLYVQSSANGLLDTNEYGMPITQFAFLPQEFIGIYNFFACGNANYGCPSVEGIDISGVSQAVGEGGGDEEEGEDEMSEQQTTLMFQLCKLTQQAVDNLATKEPTSSPIVSEEDGIPTKAPTNSLEPTSNTTATTTDTPAITAQPINLPTTITTSPTKPPTLPQCPPLYTSGVTYNAGDMVSQLINEETNQYNYYQCKLFPMSGWCSQDAYEPSVGLSWSEAWNYVGECLVDDEVEVTQGPMVAPSSATTTSPSATVTLGPVVAPSTATTSPTPTSLTPQMPTYPPTNSASSTIPTPKPTTSSPTVKSQPQATKSPVIIDVNDPPYSGPLVTTFQYEIYNSEQLPAESIVMGSNPVNDMMDVILSSTTLFVVGVVADTYGMDSLATSRESGGIDDESLENEGVDHSKDSRIFIPPYGDNRRQLEVFLDQNSVTIIGLEDIPCPTSSLPNGGTTCQKVTAQSELTLIDEPKQATQLQFSSAISRALKEPGISFAPSSGILYLGESDSSVSVIPGVTEPGSGTSPPDEEDGTPSWVVPVSIGAAGLGAIVLVLLVGKQIQKRKKNGIQYQGYISKRPNENELEGDIIGSGGGSSDDIQIQVGDQAKVSPLDADLENGLQEYRTPNSNPFLSSSSSSSRSSSSRSSGVPNASFSESFSSSSSSSSSTEDLASTNPKEFWKRKEAEVLQRKSEEDARSSGGQRPQGLQEAQTQSQKEAWELSTLHEVSETSLSQSNMSMVSDNSGAGSEKSVYRAGVEALVMKACPEKKDQIDDMMVEYEGREEILIGQLSSMLAAKNGDPNASETDTDDEREFRRQSTTETGISEYLSSANSSPSSREEDVSPEVIEASRAAFGEPKEKKHDNDPLSVPNDNSDASSASSSAGSSDWSSEDGFSSIGTESLNTNQSETDGINQLADMAALDSANKPQLTSPSYLDGDRPMFVPVDSPGQNGSPGSEDDQTENVKGTATREDLDEAIQAGDWKAVGATAALIANEASPPKSSSSPDREDFDASKFSISTHEQHQVDELENLVEAGDWEAVMAAATRFENASDIDSLDSGRQNMLNDSLMDSLAGSEDKKASPRSSSPESADEKNTDELRAEIEELVITVVPSELENLDEMLLQFRGREDELITTLRTMKEKSNGNVADDESAYSAALSELGSVRGDLSVFEDGSIGTPMTPGMKNSSSNELSSSSHSSSSKEGEKVAPLPTL